MNSDNKKNFTVLLGRNLSQAEDDNFAVYYELARTRLNVLLGGEVLADYAKADYGLRLLLVRMFDLNSVENKQEAGVASKSVNGYSVSYVSKSETVNNFLAENVALIAKYKKNNRAPMRSGDTIYDRF